MYQIHMWLKKKWKDGTIAGILLGVIGGVALVAYLRFKQERSVKFMEEAYCMKEKAKRPFKAFSNVTMKNGRRAMEGPCDACGTKMYKILGA